MKVAVLGAGKIGEAVARRIADSKQVSKVIMTKRNPASIQSKLPSKLEVTSDNKKAAKEADLIIISVKAGDARNVLEEISPSVHEKIVISLMAAISIRKLQKVLPKAKIVRAMPNIAATIGEAITAYATTAEITPDDLKTLQFILSRFGDHIRVPESLMDAITALSGSGPAYIAVLIEAMVTAGVKVGIPREIAFELVTKTLTGTADLLSLKRIHPAELRDMVTTPAGTTIAGVYELEKGSVRTSIMNAVEAATQAAERVAKRFDAES